MDPATADGSTSQAAEARRPLNVMIVDDDPVSRLMAGHMVTSAGHGAPMADSVTAAEEILGTTAVDVVVCDYLMPGRTGLELVSTCVERNLPMVLLTGATDGYLDDERMTLVAATLTKPVSSDNLLSVVTSLGLTGAASP